MPRAGKRGETGAGQARGEAAAARRRDDSVARAVQNLGGNADAAQVGAQIAGRQELEAARECVVRNAARLRQKRRGCAPAAGGRERRLEKLPQTGLAVSFEPRAHRAQGGRGDARCVAVGDETVVAPGTSTAASIVSTT